MAIGLDLGYTVSCSGTSTTCQGGIEEAGAETGRKRVDEPDCARVVPVGEKRCQVNTLVLRSRAALSSEPASVFSGRPVNAWAGDAS